MDSNTSANDGQNLRQVARKLLGGFFQSLESFEPWWFSTVSPVNGECKTSLTNLLGLEHEAGLQFLCSARLLKAGPKKNSYSIHIEEWELFMVQEELDRIMEIVNRTSISHSNYFFTNIRNKEKLAHRPMDRFNGRNPKPSKALDISARQRKFHKQLSDKLLSLHVNDAWRVEGENKENEAEELSDDEITEALKPSVSGWDEKYVCLDEKKYPNTFKLFGSEA
jgi:plasmid maintenance system killer protein